MDEAMQVLAGGRVCVAIGAPTVGEALGLAKAAESQADVIEIRLDSLTEPALAPFFAELRKPLLFTNRPTWEGGGWSGPEEARVAFLAEAIQAGAAYVDIELKSEPGHIQRLVELGRASRTAVVVSWHYFDSTPSASALASILQEQYRSGAQIGKIVTMAHSFQDVLRVFALQTVAAEMGFPLITFCMGKAGVISRVATLELGGYMTYAAPDGGAPTAPGQFALTPLRQILKGIAAAGA